MASLLPSECQNLMIKSVKTFLVRPLFISIPIYVGEEQNIKKPQKTQHLADLPQYIICIALAPSFQKAI